MKYECKDCGMVFDQSEAVVKGDWEKGELDTCPFCGSENLNEDYKETEHEEERDLTSDEKAELAGEYWMEVESGN